jgi:hypothetical protein
MTLGRRSLPLLAVGLIGYPVCILAYWCLNPAYGLLDSASILRAGVGHGTIATIANAFALAACLLSIPATLAAMLAIGDESPKLAIIGGAMSIVGWVAVFGALMLDPVASRSSHTVRRRTSSSTCSRVLRLVRRSSRSTF